MSEIVLIDGNNILKKAFYHVPIQANASGFHTNAICGFLNVLLMLAVEEKTEYMTIVFGQEGRRAKSVTREFQGADTCHKGNTCIHECECY